MLFLSPPVRLEKKKEITLSISIFKCLEVEDSSMSLQMVIILDPRIFCKPFSNYSYHWNLTPRFQHIQGPLWWWTIWVLMLIHCPQEHWLLLYHPLTTTDMIQNRWLLLCFSAQKWPFYTQRLPVLHTSLSGSLFISEYTFDQVSKPKSRAGEMV